MTDENEVEASAEELEEDQDALVEEMFESPPGELTKLDAAGVKTAARVANIIDAKGPDGEFLYTNREVRDFMCACIFELGLPLTTELEAVMYNFLDDVDLGDKEADSAPDPTMEETLLAVRGYFDANPLHPKLAAEFAAFGREEAARDAEGFKGDDGAAQKNAARAAAGLAEERKQAPTLEESTPGRPKPKLKKGLS